MEANENLRDRLGAVLLTIVSGSIAFTGIARAHGGGIRDPTPGEFVVPTWLFLASGGGVVLFSFLLTTVVTDRTSIEAVHAVRASLPSPSHLGRLGHVVGIAGLLFVVVTGVLGPEQPIQNGAILLVWVGWWAGLVMTAYLLGNPWPALDPWRPIAAWLRELNPGVLPDGERDLPDWLGTWPRVVALLLLVWLELVTPLAEEPRVLAIAIVGYSVLTVTGMTVFGDAWTNQVDPIAEVFRTYSLLAPIQRADSGFTLRIPGSRLTDGVGMHGSQETVAVTRIDAAFVVALLWGTTFDGLASTPMWVRSIGDLVASGIPPRAFYLFALVAGFGVSYGGFRLVVRLARFTGPTFLATDVLEPRFARGLVPIAAGYHLAHYLGYFLGLAPSLWGALTSPLSATAASTVLSLPPNFGYLTLAFVLVGHVVAVWIAHSVAYRSFPGHVQAVQSQYPITVLMIAYTMLSLGIIAQPSVAAPYL